MRFSALEVEVDLFGFFLNVLFWLRTCLVCLGVCLPPVSIFLGIAVSLVASWIVVEFRVLVGPPRLYVRGLISLCDPTNTSLLCAKWKDANESELVTSIF